MTFLEKAIEIDKQEGKCISESSIIRSNCPYEYGLEAERKCNKIGEENCFKCWNREMPDTEEFVEPKCTFETEVKNAYNQGLNDAWELAKKLYYYCGITTKELRKIYDIEEGVLSEFGMVLRKFTPQEALAKLKAYEEAQSKVVVGDVVEITHCDEKFKGLVLDILDEISFVLLTENGMVESYVDERVKKTGKHLDISSILEQIGE